MICGLSDAFADTFKSVSVWILVVWLFFPNRKARAPLYLNPHEGVNIILTHFRRLVVLVNCQLAVGHMKANRG